jgi:replicative DNA helicase|nr:MAG: DnaB-like helicase C terminal domain [Bacteriophage sp.]UVY67136.1 MAG: DnaB-like helicase C terminal domain [Bacteriophage sp.]UWI09478.1 MAG: DnaB-like helicase C terminal domain [Bacteriophage sp.]UWI35709.1 MAG: DnaB-like helicase C terminal domain [Bacteriophage sp.]
MKSFNLPSDKDVESVVLGMLLIESTAINAVSSVLTKDVFFNEANAAVYDAIDQVAKDGDVVDMMLVVSKLSKMGKLDEIGGPFYIAQLTSKVAMTTNLLAHALYLKELYMARQLILSGHKIMAMALDRTLDIEDTTYSGIKMLENIARGMTVGTNTADLRTLSHESMSMYERRKENLLDGRKTGILTGIDKLDNTLLGLKGGQLVILAARPAMGKTAFALNIARTAAMSGHPTVIFSLEMSGVSLSDRMLIAHGDFNAAAFRKGALTDTEEANLSQSVDCLGELPITVDDTSGLQIQQISSVAKNLQRKGKCELVIIDYLQLVRIKSENRNYSREQEVAETTKFAKGMAKSLNVPVVLLSQLSRKCEERQDKTPILSDLRESGSIEQDADIVLMLHRPAYYDRSEEQGMGIVRVAKNRDGRTGDVKFHHNKTLTRFTDYDIPCPF